jgi:CRISPR-associated protein Cas1
MLDDLHLLPKFRDSLSYLYIEHARIDRHEKSIAIHNPSGIVPVPASSLVLLMLGPGVSVTHAAITTLAELNCLVVWCGEENVRFYALGTGGTRSGASILHQARLVSDEAKRLEVVQRMYRMRFNEDLGTELTVEQLRGMEGVRVRESYALASKMSGVEWNGRSYDRTDWRAADPVNRALSCANSCLYGICHAAILTTGYSAALGFIHTGKQLSFVYDIADLYKAEISIPVAFEIAGLEPENLERATRLRCRDRFRESKLLQRIIPDIQKCLGVRMEEGPSAAIDSDPALPTDLWTPESEMAAKASIEEAQNEEQEGQAPA